jgi:hypothetical protein
MGAHWNSEVKNDAMPHATSYTMRVRQNHLFEFPGKIPSGKSVCRFHTRPDKGIPTEICYQKRNLGEDAHRNVEQLTSQGHLHIVSIDT